MFKCSNVQKVFSIGINNRSKLYYNIYNIHYIYYNIIIYAFLEYFKKAF